MSKPRRFLLLFSFLVGALFFNSLLFKTNARTVEPDGTDGVGGIAPDVSFSADKTALLYGESTTLRWDTLPPTDCVASGDWSGDKGTSGLESTGPLTSGKTYNLSCTNTGGTTSASVTVTVGLPPTLVIVPGSYSLPQDGSTFQLTAKYDPDGPSGSAAEQDVTASATWSSDNTNIVTVNNTSQKGFITSGSTTGTTIVRALYNNGLVILGATSDITVTALGTLNFSCAPIPTEAALGETVSWSVSNLSGGTGSYTYSWSGTDGLAGSDPSVTKVYTSVDPLPKQGSLTVTSGSQNVTKTCSSLTIWRPSLIVTPSSASVQVGVFQQFQVDYDRDGSTTNLAYSPQNVTSLASWSSSNSGVATVDNTTNKGRATGVSTGLASITASYNDGYSTLTSTPGTLTVVSQPQLNVSTNSLAFTDTVAGSLPGAQTFTISNPAGGTNGIMYWNISAAISGDQTWPWLKVSSVNGSTSGTTAQSITVIVDTTGMYIAGTYTGTITVTGVNTLNSPQTITVNLTLNNAASTGFDSRLKGWAWSENVGWISFSCVNQPNACAMSPYGVDMSQSTRVLSGYAWAEGVGWVTFNENDLKGISPLSSTPCPTAPCEARFDRPSKKLVGWARAVSPIQNPTAAASWDGWIHLDNATVGYGPVVALAEPQGRLGLFDIAGRLFKKVLAAVPAENFTGWAWGSTASGGTGESVIGAASFSCSNSNVCAQSNYGVFGSLNTPPSVTTNTPTAPGNYCTAPFGWTLSWNFSDPDPADSQNAYQVTIRDGGTVVKDTGEVSSGSSSYAIPTGTLDFNKTYSWDVKVWDTGTGDPAQRNTAQASGSNFTTIKHAAPAVSFTWTPTNPAIDEQVTFTDTSGSFGGSAINAWQWTLPADATVIPPTTLNTPQVVVKFSSSGQKNITLQTTDSDALSCSVTQASVKVGGKIPRLKEIVPSR